MDLNCIQVYDGSYHIYVDGMFLKDTPQNLYAKGEFTRAPILAGVTQDEGTYDIWAKFFWPYAYYETPPPFNQSQLEDYLWSGLRNENVLSPDSADILLDAVLHEYIDWTIADDPDADFFQAAVDAIGDVSIKCPMDSILRAHVSAGDPVYKYVFKYPVTTM